MADEILKKIALSSIYEIFDLSFFLSLILVMILFLLRRKRIRSFQSRLFRRMIFSILFLLQYDGILWLLNGKTVLPVGITLFTYNLYYLAETIPLILWLCYLDYFIFHSRERLKKHWYYMQPFLLVLLILIASVPSGFIFSVDANGIYHRGPGIPLILAINAAVLFSSMILVLRRRKDVGLRALSIIVIFEVIPIVGSIIQILMYQTSFLWPTVALATIFVYLYLEGHRGVRDYLTGLYNRQHIDDLVQSRITEYKRRGGFALLMIDMDGFKEINDRFGHKEGDRALITMANILNVSVRNIDGVGRFGGDEFLILMEEDDPKKVEQIIDRIQEKVQEVNSRTTKEYQLKFSYGYTIFSPSEHQNIDELQKCVDDAMYADKTRKKTALG